MEFVNDFIFHVHSLIAKCPPTCNHLKEVDFDKELRDDFENMEYNAEEDTKLVNITRIEETGNLKERTVEGIS
eukprot:11075718-Ditylum_brightwellii.AAC.1